MAEPHQHLHFDALTDNIQAIHHNNQAILHGLTKLRLSCVENTLLLRQILDLLPDSTNPTQPPDEPKVFDEMPTLKIINTEDTVDTKPVISSSVDTELVQETTALLPDLGLVLDDALDFQCGKTIVWGSSNVSDSVTVSLESVVQPKESYVADEAVESHETLPSKLRCSHKGGSNVMNRASILSLTSKLFDPGGSNFNGSDEFVGVSELPQDFLRAASACLAFALDRPDMLGRLSMPDIEVVVASGTPFLFKNCGDSLWRLRLFLGGVDTNVSDSGRAQTVDLMRFILRYASTLFSFENSPQNKDTVDSSVRNLLRELVQLSYNAPESSLPRSLQNQFPDSFVHTPCVTHRFDPGGRYEDFSDFTLMNSNSLRILLSNFSIVDESLNSHYLHYSSEFMAILNGLDRSFMSSILQNRQRLFLTHAFTQSKLFDPGISFDDAMILIGCRFNVFLDLSDIKLWSFHSSFGKPIIDVSYMATKTQFTAGVCYYLSGEPVLLPMGRKYKPLATVVRCDPFLDEYIACHLLYQCYVLPKDVNVAFPSSTSAYISCCLVASCVWVAILVTIGAFQTLQRRSELRFRLFDTIEPSQNMSIIVILETKSDAFKTEKNVETSNDQSSRESKRTEVENVLIVTLKSFDPGGSPHSTEVIFADEFDLLLHHLEDVCTGSVRALMSWYFKDFGDNAPWTITDKVINLRIRPLTDLLLFTNCVDHVEQQVTTLILVDSEASSMLPPMSLLVQLLLQHATFVMKQWLIPWDCC